MTPANKSRIALSVGEPKHSAPEFVLEALRSNLKMLETYPSTRGTDELRDSIAQWLCQRFSLNDANTLSALHILPVNGTREALFAIAQCVLDRTVSGRDVLMPNPFYQIYEGAALLAGCQPRFYSVSASADEDLDAIDPKTLPSCQLFYLCNPGNPAGGVLSQKQLCTLINWAQEYDFTIVSDECYSEIYRQQSAPPVGLLQAAEAMGNSTYKHCLAFHSLSKRSNLPGLRSGFVAGDASIIEQFLLYRTYHGCSMAPPVQHASALAWADEQHVKANRAAYDEKYAAVLPILQPHMQISQPPAGFYLWPELGMDDEQFTQKVYSEQNIAVVPGSYLGRESNGVNPASGHTRLALVAPLDECVEAANRMVETLSAG